jgi:GT2 family glycosyltransferase
MNAPQTISVIVCTRDRPALAFDTVDSIVAGDLVPDEIVVVDQSRYADPRLAARGEPVHYVWTQSRGLCRARNLGLSHSRGGVIAFSDDDVRVDRGWLRALVGAIGTPEDRVVAAGQVIPAPPERAGAFAASYYVDDTPVVYSGRIARDPLGGGNMAIHRDAFEAVGTFDERIGAGARYPAADDNDFGLRLLEAGFRIVYVPEAIVYHRAWRSRWQYPVIRWRYGRGKGGFYGKHLLLSDRHIQRRLARDLGVRLRRLPRNAVRDPRQALGDVVYTTGVLTGLAQWYALDRKK